MAEITNDWIKSVRPRRNVVDASRSYAFVSERERAAHGEVVDIATIFLTNRECPWKCLMCDLWKNTTLDTVLVGAIPNQIELALAQLDIQRSNNSQIKLYNSGSFFDPKAIPIADHPRIAELVRPFERVIVECHPALINDRVLAFRDLLGDTKLEIAMGLETADPVVLPKLNKGISLDSFRAAAEFLHTNDIDLRVFVLVKPPWHSEDEAIDWAARSVELATECHATVAALIPTRFGNGALEQLAERGEFAPPKLSTLESAFDQSLDLVQKTGCSTRVFADLWDLGQFSNCEHCRSPRMKRMEQMNLGQELLHRTTCNKCGHGTEV